MEATKSEVHKGLVPILEAFPAVFQDRLQLPPERSK
ncbi:hypothetical protein A2U01_0092147, partial [Trifolium medium]|nr:hypothetical protein [Trifolium medium]